MSWAAVAAAGVSLVGSEISKQNASKGGGGSPSQWDRNQQERNDWMHTIGTNEYVGTPGVAAHTEKGPIIGYTDQSANPWDQFSSRLQWENWNENNPITPIYGPDKQVAATQAGGMAAYRPAFTEQLGKAALGQGPSIADAQLKMAMDRNLSQQMAAAKSNRGVSAGLNARNVANAAANTFQGTAQQGAIDKLKEQQANQAQFMAWNSQLAENAGVKQPSTYSQAAANQADQFNTSRQDQQNAGLLNAGAGLLTTFAGSGGGGGGSGNFSPNAQQQNAGWSKGGKIPGKAEVSGDSETNDKVHAMLSPGEIVIPRTVVAKGHAAASKFVKDVLAKERPIKMWEGGGVKKPAKPKEEPGLFASMFGPSQEDEKKIGEGIKKRINPDKAKGLSDYFNAESYAQGGMIKSDIDRLFNDKEEQKKTAMSTANPSQSGKSTLQNTDNYAEGGLVKRSLEGLYNTKESQKKTATGPVPKSNESTIENTDNYAKGGAIKADAGFGAILAAQAELNKKLAELERKYGKKG